MEIDNQMLSLCNQLAQAVELSLDPSIPQLKRVEAYNACEEFKEKSPHCIPCAIYLATNGTHLVRHFGFQLMEYCVKYKWYYIDQQQKLLIRETTMHILEDAHTGIADHSHLKDALSRVIVEMIKREWPQHWLNLFPDLFRISYTGTIQTEIILLIFLRLVEDVAVLQTLESPQRRKDLYQSLTLNVESIFSFLLSIMEKHYEISLSREAKESIRIVQYALLTLCEFIEWAPITRMLSENGKLLSALCVLISDANFQIEVANCFFQLLNRKGKYEDMASLASYLFGTNLIYKFSQLDLLLENTILNEQNYSFLKKISELMLSLSIFMCNILEKSDKTVDTVIQKVISNEKFELYLKILVALCNHTSYSVLCNVVSAWKHLFKHKIMSRNIKVLSCIPECIRTFAPKLIRAPYPESGNTTNYDVTKYIIFDFDSEESYITFFYRYRVELMDVFRSIVTLSPHLIFDCMERWMTTVIPNISFDTICEIGSEEFLQWEALVLFLEGVIPRFPDNYDLPIENGLKLIDLCLNVKTSDPIISSFLLSCVSNLSIFIKKSSAEVINLYLPRVINMIFVSMVFEVPGETKYNRSKTVKSLRRHAGSLMIKMSNKYADLLLPLFEDICLTYKKVKSEINQFSKMEINLLLEALIIINNNFNNFEQQSLFLKDVISEISDYWKQTCMNVFEDYNKFMAFIALDADPVNIQAEIFLKNRQHLLYCTDILLAVVNRSTYPDQEDKALQGGFFITYNKDGKPIFCNPSAPYVVPLLPGIFLLIKTLNSLWTNEARLKLPQAYKDVYDMTDIECKVLTGSTRLEKNSVRSSLEPTMTSMFSSVQNYLIALYESCFQILSKSCQSLRYSFYDLPNFAPSFIASVFSNIGSIPDYRVRILVKQFLKIFIVFCPSEKYDNLLIPILVYFSEHMVERLINRRKYLLECKESGVLNEEEDEECISKEVIENLIITQLSREYMDVVKVMLITPHFERKSCNIQDGDEDNSVSGSQTNLNTVTVDTLSELGMKLMTIDSIYRSILSFLLHATYWDDSTNSFKAVILIPLIIKQLVANGNMTSEIASETIAILLQGIRIHGQHDSNLGSLINSTILIYEMVRPNFPYVLEVLKMVPAIDIDALLKFDERILKDEGKCTKVDKGKKEKFKKLIDQLIGRNIGQLFKRKELVRDLPKLEIYKTKGENIVNSCSNTVDVGIANFFK